MIRFIDIGFQMWLSNSEEDGAVRQFAFFDTCLDRFVDIGGTQTWDSWQSFAEDHFLSKRYNNDAQPLERFRGLCPAWVPGLEAFDLVLDGGLEFGDTVVIHSPTPAGRHLIKGVMVLRVDQWNEENHTLTVDYDFGSEIAVQAVRRGLRVGPPV